MIEYFKVKNFLQQGGIAEAKVFEESAERFQKFVILVKLLTINEESYSQLFLNYYKTTRNI